MNTQIMIVEDDPDIRAGLSQILELEGYQTAGYGSAFAAEEALSEMEKTALPDVLILDVLLPDEDGFSFCRRLRERYRFPILFLTCCEEENDIVRGLDSGGDDYVVKPFRMRELVSRIRALVRRGNAGNDRLESGGLILDCKKRTALYENHSITLTPIEFSILLELVRENGRTVSRERLLHAVWEYGCEYIEDNTLSVHMSRLREKLALGAGKITTVRGEGYCFQTEPPKMEGESTE